MAILAVKGETRLAVVRLRASELWFHPGPEGLGYLGFRADTEFRVILGCRV